MTDPIRTAIRAASEVERRLLLDLIVPADATPDACREAVSRAVSDAAVEIAERDETIAKQRGQIVGSRAMLEAIRTMAGIGQSDPTVDTLEVVRRRLECDREIAADLRAQRSTARAERDAAISQGQLAAAEAATLRDRVRELEARPVLTVERLGAVITSKRTGEEGPRIGTPATIYAQLTEGGAVTLPAQDRAEDVIAAYVDEYAATEEREGKSPPGKWADAPANRRAWCAGVMTRALASLGAPAKTPSVPADVATVESVARAIWCAYNNAEETGWNNMTVGVRAMWMAAARAGIVASVPADVFAGVSVADLACVAADADVAYIQPDDGPRDSWTFVVTAVLDALRVKLVAPVDPEAVARVALDPVELHPMPGKWNASVRNVRMYLDVNNIPVTPEAGKAGSP